MTETVVAVDPGKMTGLAYVTREETILRKITSSELDEEAFAPAFRSMVSNWRGDDLRLVVERFTITAQTAKNSQAPWSLEIIGVVKQCCRDVGYPVEAITWQLPAAAKGFATNDKLKRLDLWHRGGEGHALDALRHAVLYFVNRGWTSEKLLA